MTQDELEKSTWKMVHNASHFYNVLMIAYADGKLSEGEEKFITSLAEKYQIGNNELTLIKTGAFDQNVFRPNTVKEKFQQLFELIIMMMADGKSDESEMKICIRITNKYGYNESLIEDIIDELWNLMGGNLQNEITDFDDLLDFLWEKFKTKMESNKYKLKNYPFTEFDKEELFRKSMGFKTRFFNI